MFVDEIRRLKKINKILRNEKGLLLDVGCGNMEIDRYFKNKRVFDKKIIGLDSNINILIDAKKNGLTVVCADGLNLPFKNNIFDSAICSEVLEHIQDDSRVIKELNRVLKSQTICIVSVPYAFSERVIPFNNLVKKMYDISKIKFLHVRKGYDISTLKVLFNRHYFKLTDYHYDLKLIGAIFTLLYYYFTNLKSRSFNEIMRNIFLRLSKILAILFILDGLIKKEGFTLFAKFKKID